MNLNEIKQERNLSEYEQNAGTFLGHTSCPKCGSEDNLALYQQDDGSVNGTCFGICKTDENNGYMKSSDITDDMRQGMSAGVRKKREPITQEQIDQIKARTTYDAKGYRGIGGQVLKFTGILTELDKEGNVAIRYYPAYDPEDLSILTGYKRRFHPKNFDYGPIGIANSTSALLGMEKHNKGGKRVLITGGEEDYAAAVQMLRKYQRDSGNGDRDPLAVVSPHVGETGCKKQLQRNFDYLNSFDIIILGMDNDEAGQKAMAEYARILPQHKVHIAGWDQECKDINGMLKAGKQKQFISAYFDAKKFSPSGILSSAELMQHVIDRAHTPRIPLPPFLKKLNTMLCGGIPLGYIMNILAASGSGKSTVVNELLYHWIFNSPHKVGVVSLEATAGEYYTNILSRHLGKKIELIESPEEKVAYLTSPEVTEREKELRYDENGEPRFYLLDDRGDVKSLKEKIEYLIAVNGCKVIIIDVLQDILDELPTEQEAMFMRYLKQMVALHEATFILINHSRKNGSGTKANSRGAELTEEDISGSSTIFKSGGINLIISRDKLAECEIERNTLKVVLSKARGAGNTGPAGEIYYDNKKHTMVELTEEMKEVLIANAGAVSASDSSLEVPQEFIEQDLNSAPNDDVDSPFEIS